MMQLETRKERERIRRCLRWLETTREVKGEKEKGSYKMMVSMTKPMYWIGLRPQLSMVRILAQ
jgi:hypothetical protein